RLRRIRAHVPLHPPAHDLVGIGHPPAAVGEPAAGVFVRPTWRLHDAVEGQAAGDGDLHAVSVSITSRATSVAALKSCVSRFLVRANAIPLAVSKNAKLPPTPPTPNAVGGSFGSWPGTPTA